MSSEVRFHQRPDDHHYAVCFPYDPDIVTLIKRVPSHARSWNPEIKEWRVSDVYVNELAALLKKNGHHVLGVGAANATASTSQWAEVLFQRVGEARVESVFRALTRVLHPDNLVTGDGSLQQELNNARDDLR